ncbi:SPOR domain-containing protein [Polymorphobacter fuscus]|nr:SPOR domain-containing protein [Polymorphobacter fuscus]
MRSMLLAAVALAAAPAPAQQRPKPAVAPAAAPAQPPSVRAGVDLWRAGDWAGAVAIWQPFANAGDPDAMFNVGQAYKLGRAVPMDKAIARDWYRKAALKGHLPAQANLGILLFQAGEKAEAARWLKQAADRGEMRAQYVLGVAHWNGDGVARSLPLAFAYLTRSSGQGLAEATGALSNLTRTISPAERANGVTIATSLGAGSGVPAAFASKAAPMSTAELNRMNAEAVQRPAPRGAEAAPVASAPAPRVAVAAASPVTPPSAVSQPTPQAVLQPAPQPASQPVSQPASQPVSQPASQPVSQPASRPVDLAAAAPVVERPLAPAVRTTPLPASQPAPAPGPAPTPVATAAATTVPAARPAEAPRAIQTAQTADKTPERTQAKAPNVKPKAPEGPTGWRVQLGAFSKKALAEAAWADIQQKQKGAVGKAKPIFEPGASIVKLQMGPYKTRELAKDACAKVAFSGRACFVTEG